MIGPVDAIKIGAGLFVGAVCAGIVFFQVGHWKGEAYGRAAERQAALEKSMDLIRDRNETNAEIDAMDDDALCHELGGEWVRPDNICK